MNGALPATIDPYRLAEQSARLKGDILLAKMPRLRDLCIDEGGKFSVDLVFSHGEPDLVSMTGKISGLVTLSCQRCLEPMQLTLSLAPQVYFQRPGENRKLAEELDTVNADEHVDLYRLLEDEVLLALPMIPMHEPDQCTAKKYLQDDTGTGANKDSPFAVLAQIKRKH